MFCSLVFYFLGGGGIKYALNPEMSSRRGRKIASYLTFGKVQKTNGCGGLLSLISQQILCRRPNKKIKTDCRKAENCGSLFDIKLILQCEFSCELLQCVCLSCKFFGSGSTFFGGRRVVLCNCGKLLNTRIYTGNSLGLFV